MNSEEAVGSITDCMMEQKILLEELKSIIREVSDSVYNRDWDSLQSGLNAIDDASVDFRLMEDKRLGYVGTLPPRFLDESLDTLEVQTMKRFRKIKAELRASLLLVKSRTNFIVKHAETKMKDSKEFIRSISELTESGTYDSSGGKTQSSKNNPFIVSHRS